MSSDSSTLPHPLDSSIHKLLSVMLVFDFKPPQNSCSVSVIFKNKLVMTLSQPNPILSVHMDRLFDLSILLSSILF